MTAFYNGRFRSRQWFDNPGNPSMTALYLERYQNQAFTLEELQSGRPIIGIAQTGSDISPCNKIHVFLMDRIKAGIRDAGGIPLEFPVHPIQETGKRPTAALDRNLTYLGLVEVLHGYPIDGVVLTTGCDKTTPAMLMGAATVDLPAIALNGGPMLDGWWKGERAGSGTSSPGSKYSSFQNQLPMRGRTNHAMSCSRLGVSSGATVASPAAMYS